MGLAERQADRARRRAMRSEHPARKTASAMVGTVIATPSINFNNAIRYLKAGDYDNVLDLYRVLTRKLRKIGKAPDDSRRHTGVIDAKGVRTINLVSLLKWIESVNKASDEQSISQLVALQATAKRRIE